MIFFHLFLGEKVDFFSELAQENHIEDYKNKEMMRFLCHDKIE
jgi:hypothetical protein